MAAIDFPNNPQIDDTHPHEGTTWIWNGESWSRIAEDFTYATALGVGTTSPQEELHIKTETPVIRLEDTSGGYVQIVGNDGNLRFDIDNLNNIVDSNIKFNIDNTTRMIIDDSGHVGIGTTTPYSKLHVRNHDTGRTSYNVLYDDLLVEGSNAGMTISSANSSLGGISFADPDSPNAGLLLYDHSNNNMSFYTGEQKRMWITAAGNVIVGMDNSTGARALRLETSDTNSSQLHLKNSDGETQIYEYLNKLNISKNGDIKMVIDSDGKVGIGTETLVDAKLEVSGGISSYDGFSSHQSNLFIAQPGGASLEIDSSSPELIPGTNGQVTGAIKVQLPQSWTNTMMSMQIRVFDYELDETFDLFCGGYNHTGDNSWHRTFAYIISSPHEWRNFPVRFAHDGSKCCIYIGDTDSDWHFLKVNVLNFVAGHSLHTLNRWGSGWDISIETTIPTPNDEHLITRLSPWKVDRGTGHIYNDWSGGRNFGIGTNEPPHKLTVLGDLGVGDSLSGSNLDGIVFSSTSTSGYHNTIKHTDNGLEFDNTATIQRDYLFLGGNVEIGNSSTSSELKVNDHKVFHEGTEIPANVDLNDYRTTGFYIQTANSDTTSSGAANWPVDKAGILQVLNYEDGGTGTPHHTSQMYHQYATSNVWTRYYYDSGSGGAWTGWVNLNDDADFSSYLPLSGGTMSGNLTVNGSSGVYTSGWFRNNHTGEGLYNETNQNHFYSKNSNYWHMSTKSDQTHGGLVFYKGYNTGNDPAIDRKGSIYWSSTGFGLLDNDGSWAFRTVGNEAQLFYDGSEKLNTKSTGVDITGSLTTTGTQYFNFVGGTLMRVGNNPASNVTLMRVNANSISNDKSDYGFSIKYRGYGGGNDNSYSIYSDNQASATQIEAFKITQDGKLYQGGTNEIWHSGNLPTSSLFDGDYNSLSNKPSLFDGDYNSLSNKPSLFDGNYSSLSGSPDVYTKSETYSKTEVNSITANLGGVTSVFGETGQYQNGVVEKVTNIKISNGWQHHPIGGTATSEDSKLPFELNRPTHSKSENSQSRFMTGDGSVLKSCVKLSFDPTSYTQGGFSTTKRYWGQLKIPQSTWSLLRQPTNMNFYAIKLKINFRVRKQNGLYYPPLGDYQRTSYLELITHLYPNPTYYMSGGNPVALNEFGVSNSIVRHSVYNSGGSIAAIGFEHVLGKDYADIGDSSYYSAQDDETHHYDDLLRLYITPAAYYNHYWFSAEIEILGDSYPHDWYWYRFQQLEDGTEANSNSTRDPWP